MHRFQRWVFGYFLHFLQTAYPKLPLQLSNMTNKRGVLSSQIQPNVFALIVLSLFNTAQHVKHILNIELQYTLQNVHVRVKIYLFIYFQMEKLTCRDRLPAYMTNIVMMLLMVRWTCSLPHDLQTCHGMSICFPSLLMLLCNPVNRLVLRLPLCLVWSSIGSPPKPLFIWAPIQSQGATCN